MGNLNLACQTWLCMLEGSNFTKSRSLENFRPCGSYNVLRIMHRSSPVGQFTLQKVSGNYRIADFPPVGGLLWILWFNVESVWSKLLTFVPVAGAMTASSTCVGVKYCIAGIFRRVNFSQMQLQLYYRYYLWVKFHRTQPVLTDKIGNHR